MPTRPTDVVAKANALLDAGQAQAAVDLLINAAKNGDGDALHELALWHVYGSPVPRSFAAARALFEKAGLAGHRGGALTHAVFVAIGYLVSALVAERGTAGGIAIGVWLFFVLIYDMALLGMLVVDQGRTISVGFLNVLLLLNPTDAYRLLNLGSGNAGSLSGLGGIAENVALGRSMLVSALAVWTLLPLAAATLVFSRREL